MFVELVSVIMFDIFPWKMDSAEKRIFLGYEASQVLIGQAVVRGRRGIWTWMLV